MFSPSYGTVQFNGNDIFNNIDLFRKNLSLCPQHNVNFPYLTTLDHLIFFGMVSNNHEQRILRIGNKQVAKCVRVYQYL